MAIEAAGGLQLLLFPRRQLRRLDLFDLIAEQVDPAGLHRFVHVRLVELAAQGAQTGIRLAVRLQQRRVASEPVQVGHMPFRGQEGLILVLAVYVDQPPPHVPQDGDRHRAAADAAGPLSSGRDSPLDEQASVLIRFDVPFPQSIRRRGRQIGKQGRHPGLAASCAHDIPADPFPQHGVDRVDHDGFARARLTGQDVEAGIERDIRPLDHRDILNVQALQHPTEPLPVVIRLLAAF